MAKVIFSSIIADARGKVGDVIYSKNRAGAYTRATAIVSNPNTTAQQAVRDRIGDLSTAWAALTDTQRYNWEQAVHWYKSTNVFGNAKYPSGFNLYIKLNSNLVQAGQAPLDSPLPPAATLQLSNYSLLAEATGQVFEVDCNLSAVPANYAVVVMATEQLSSGKNYFRNLLREIAVLVPTDVFPADLSAEYVAKFGAFTAGGKIGFSLITINLSTGQKSVPFESSTIIGS